MPNAKRAGVPRLNLSGLQVGAPSAVVEAPKSGGLCSDPQAVEGPLDPPQAAPSACPSQPSHTSQEPHAATDLPATPSVSAMPDTSAVMPGQVGNDGGAEHVVVQSAAPEQYPVSVYKAVRTGQLQLPSSDETWSQIQDRFLGSADQGCLGFR